MAFGAMAGRACRGTCWDSGLLELIERVGCKTASWRRKGNNHLGWFPRLRNQRTGYWLVLERILPPVATRLVIATVISGKAGVLFNMERRRKNAKGCDPPAPKTVSKCGIASR